jgi:hypothetical protein
MEGEIRMKSRVFISSLLLGVLLLAGSLWAETYTYPREDPVVSITFPDSWTVTQDPNYEKGLVALSDDEEIEIDLWVLEEQEVEDDVLAALEAAGVEVATIIDEWVMEFDVEEEHTGEVNGIHYYFLSGTGMYKDDHSEVRVGVTFFSPDGETIFVLMYWGNEEAAEAHAEELEQIRESFEVPE